MNKKLALVFCLLPCLLLCACGRRTVILENRFSRGQELRYRMATRGEGTTSITGLPGQTGASESPFKMDMELTYRTTVKDINAKGEAELEIRFENFTSLNESGRMTIRLEADEKGARFIAGDTVSKDAPGLDGLKALFKNPTVLTMDRRGRVLSLAQPGGVGMLLPNTDLSSMLKQGQFLLPEGPVRIGSSWKEKKEILAAQGAGGMAPAPDTVKLDITYTLAGIVPREGRRCAEIRLRGEITTKNIAMEMPQEEGVQMQTTFDRLQEKVSGSIYFDPERGCLVEMHLDLEQEMAMTSRLAKDEAKMAFTAATKMKMATDLKLVE